MKRTADMAHQHSPRFLKLVEDCQTHIKEIGVEDLKRKLENKDTFQLVDVREADEYRAGRIPGAKHLCKGIIERDVEASIPDTDTEIVLYCGGGFRSALAAENLQKMGYKRVLSLAGGWRTWTERNFPTEKP
jgi:rhodanese-related sulfurtransferase